MVFVVSEIGVNWEGDFDLVRHMMIESKNIGCDAVKFQAYTEEMVKNHPEKKRLLKTAITTENIEQINNISKSVGIEWFCTPMYSQAVDFLDPYVKRFKIREFDGRNLLENATTELFQRLIKTGKEIIVSSEKSPKNCKFYRDPQIKWLYCVPKYPCKLEEINFSELVDFNGYSNHHPHFIAPLMASILGSEIIEIHITADKSKNFIDNNVSFDYNELDQLVRYIRICEKIRH